MARKSVIEFYDTDKRRRSNAPASAVCTQWDSRDSVPTGSATTTINSAHTTTAKYHTHTQLWKCYQPPFSPLLLIRWGASQVQFVFRNEPIWLVNHSKRSEAIEARQNRRFYLSSSPLAHLYMWKEYNICQSTWFKGEVLWRTCWWIHWEVGEQIEDLMGTYWELKGNIVGTRENWKKILLLLRPALN
jgi:hypothetical protein